MNAAPQDQSAPKEKPAAPRVAVITERRKSKDLSKTLLLDENGIPLENLRRRKTDQTL